jgi:hypothetical protein
VPWLSRLVAGLSLRRLGFNSRPIQMGFVVDSGHGTGVSQESFGFPQSLSFHLCSILFYMLPVPKGQTDQVWEPSKNQCSFGNRGACNSVRFPHPPTSGLLTVNIVTQGIYGQSDRICSGGSEKQYEHKCHVKLSCYALYLVICTEYDQLWCTNKTKLASSSLSAH